VATCADVRRRTEAGHSDIGVLLERASRPGSKRGRIGGEVSARSVERQKVAVDVPLVVFAMPSHPLIARGDPGSVGREALAPFILLVSDAEGDFFTMVDRLFRTAGAGPRLQPTGSVEAVKRGVFADSRALGLLPGYAVAEEVRARRVVRLTVRPPLPRMELDALLSRRRVRHPSTMELLDELRRTASAP
jgi:DNA-binding transcriptional LysR family regulator